MKSGLVTPLCVRPCFRTLERLDKQKWDQKKVEQ